MVWDGATRALIEDSGLVDRQVDGGLRCVPWNAFLFEAERRLSSVEIFQRGTFILREDWFGWVYATARVGVREWFELPDSVGVHE